MVRSEMIGRRNPFHWISIITFYHITTYIASSIYPPRATNQIIFSVELPWDRRWSGDCTMLGWVPTLRKDGVANASML